MLFRLWMRLGVPHGLWRWWYSGSDRLFLPKANMICSLFPLVPHLHKIPSNMTSKQNCELFYLATLLNEKHRNQKCSQYLPSVIFWNTDYVSEHEFCNRQWNMYWKKPSPTALQKDFPLFFHSVWLRIMFNVTRRRIIKTAVIQP